MKFDDLKSVKELYDKPSIDLIDEQKTLQELQFYINIT